ncbi:permease [Raoultella ornithinolytica]|uniref:permease n=1 Tax=Raoultella ornithinolytica TaxID=54291 RepID=UPI0012648983|nr:permease [Raoultella ornithinolytica]KAB8148249.1 permease [Raoultella ornithinolytica]MCF1302386.1 permease [Raoultella ornithinolytica]HCT2143890.1 permease [Raoultella ornithinolytica]
MAGQSSSQAASPFQWWKPALFFLVVIVGLWFVKWQPYYGKAFTAAETHSIGKSILAQADANPLKAAWDYAVVYFLAVWKAAVLGVLLGSLIQVLIPRDWLLRTLGQSRFRGTLSGVLFSLPGMMCTCCAAPVAAGMRKQQVSMGGALAFWMGNPLLNPATLVFMGFVLGWQFALIRLAAGLATVLIVATLVQKWVKEAATQPSDLPAVDGTAQGPFFTRWLSALWTLFWNTIPVYILAVLVLGAARVWLFPHADGVVGNTLFWVVAMAIAGCLFVIPTAAEIPIVQTMMLAGMGFAPALALLITLPAVSVPSLIMLHKVFPAKALWLTGGLVALCGAVVGGLALL